MRILGVVASSSREVPNAPTIGTATDVGTGRAYNNGAATVTFTAPTWNGGLPITSYVVTSSPGGFTGTGASSPITVTGLASNTNYTFTVKAVNAAGQSASSAASNSILATTVPQAPTIGTATAGNTTASVAFTAGATGGKAVSVYTATSSPGSITGTNSVSPITVSGLTNGTAYTFTVTATNANGTSTASSASNSVTPVNPIVSFWSIAQSQPNRLEGVASNSNGIYYVGVSSSSTASQTPFLFSFNRSNGNLNWQRAISIPAETYMAWYDVALDSSGNIYAMGVVGNPAQTYRYVYLAKYSSSGTFLWSKVVSQAYGYSVLYAASISIDSSDNIYIIGNYSYTTVYLWKFDTSGNLAYTRLIGTAYQSGEVNHVHATTSDVTLTLVGYQQTGKYDYASYGQIWKYNPNGTPIRYVILGGGTQGNQWIPRASVTDSSGNTYTAGLRFYFNNFASIIKLNSSLNRVSSVMLQVGGYVSLAKDSSNNLYALGAISITQGSPMYIAKFDSNLNLQWQRQITSSTTTDFYVSAITVDETNSRFAVSGRINDRLFSMYLPMDGSGIGSYTVGGYNVNYAAGSSSAQQINEGGTGVAQTSPQSVSSTISNNTLTSTTPSVVFTSTTF